MHELVHDVMLTNSAKEEETGLIDSYEVSGLLGDRELSNNRVESATRSIVASFAPRTVGEACSCVQNMGANGIL